MIRYLRALWANRHTTIVVALLVLFAGVAAYRSLPQAVFPEVRFPRVSVFVSDGYLPVHVMMVRVTEPLEQAAKGLRDVTRVRSVTTNGMSKIHVYFSRAIRPDTAYLLLEARLGQVLLPRGAHVTTRLMMPNIYPFAQYALVSRTRTSSALMPLYAFTIRPQLLDIPGVFTVDDVSRGWPQVQVALSPRRLMQWHLSAGSVVRFLRARQGPYFGGVVHTLHTQWLLTAAGRPATLAALRGLAVPIGPDATVPLASLGRIRIGPPPRLRGGAAGRWPHALLIDIAAQAHANVETVAQGVAQAVAHLRRHLPQGVHLIAIYDVARLITGSLHDVWLALIIGTVITFGVVFLFLGRADIAAATVLVVPLSLAGTFVVLHVLGLGLNIMTLGGLTAAIGALVDHAIVVMEQASHRAHAARAEDRLHEALAASADVLPMMTFATLTSALVFVPLIFLGGTTGILFRQMAIALVTALVISQLVALSVTPLLAGFLSRGSRRAVRRHRAVRRARVLYARLLRRLLRHPGPGLAATALMALATYLIFAGLPTAFLPAWNEGLIAVPYRTAASAGAATTLAVGRRFLRAALADPAIATGSVVAGQSLGNPRAPANKGDLVLTVRHGFATEPVIATLRRRFRALDPSLTMLKLHQMLVTELGNLTGAHSPLDVNLFGPDPVALAHWAERLKAALAASGDFANVSLPAAYSGPALVVTPRARALLQGLAPGALAQQMRAAFWGRRAGFLLRGSQILPIRVRVPPAPPMGGSILPEAWARLPAHVPLVPLSALARAHTLLHQPFINHQNLVPYVDIQLHPRAGEGLNVAAADARGIVRRLALPSSITAHLGGYYRQQTASFLQMGVTLILALLLLLVLVGYQLGALRPALAVLLATAQSALGALVALRLCGIPLDSTAFLGVLLVFAIVVNNGILIFAQARMRHAVPNRLDVELACRRRLRPILMTMVADVGGFLPLAIGIGHGTDLLKPLATAVMGGLSVAILASLLIGPMLYLGFARRR